MTEKVSVSKSLEHMARELKNARMARELSLEEVSKRVTIQKSYLEKIEEGDFGFLPRVYIFTYIKEYAQEMGVGNDEILEQCKKDLQIYRVTRSNVPPDTATEKPVKAEGEEHTGIRLPSVMNSVIIGVVLLVLVLVASFFAFDNGKLSTFLSRTQASLSSGNVEHSARQSATTAQLKKEKSPVSVPVAQPAQPAQPSSSALVTPGPALSASSPDSREWAKGISFTPALQSSSYQKVLVVRVVKGFSWVKVIVDDNPKSVPGTEVQTGQVLRFEAQKKIWLNVGRPENVELYLNGKKVPPFTIRTLVFE